MNKVLTVAAHPEDNMLGCGGMIVKLTQEGLKIHIMLLSDGESSRDDIIDI
jgi:LmbE family N-acetylglucosaminyl deacetylase